MKSITYKSICIFSNPYILISGKLIIPPLLNLVFILRSTSSLTVASEWNYFKVSSDNN